MLTWPPLRVAAEVAPVGLQLGASWAPMKRQCSARRAPIKLSGRRTRHCRRSLSLRPGSLAASQSRSLAGPRGSFRLGLQSGAPYRAASNRGRRAGRRQAPVALGCQLVGHSQSSARKGDQFAPPKWPLDRLPAQLHGPYALAKLDPHQRPI